jgi:asparagine synthase (glutamine-hydrolysing)
MCDASRRWWITYNGEIYNFRELRAELEAGGHRFVSRTDTEVLLALYLRDGERLLDRINGIYAFAIWDTERGGLFLARDRLGVKPLYYALDQGRLLFASEVKALLPALGSVRMRHEAVADFLTFLWVPDPATMFDGVAKLPPGHCAHYARGDLQIRQYWDMSYPSESASEEVWAGRVRDEVSRAVRRQMVSDVPIGSFLSGGIDSSAIVAEMTAAGGPIPTFTIGFGASDLAHEIVPDDIKYSRIVAKRYGTEYHEQELTPDIVDVLPKLIWHMDEPVADPACITTYMICAAARERMTVVLSGMGGDEVFAGYPRHLAARIGRIADVLPRFVRAAARSGLDRRLTLGRPGRMRGPRRNLMKLMRGIDESPLERYLTYCSYYQRAELDQLLSAELRADVSEHDPFGKHHDYARRVADEHWLNQLLYIDMKTFLPCLNLSYTDKMSMAASTEVRVPLLDDEVVALSARIPPDLKLHRFTRKYAFKRSQEGILPKDVIWRPKAGFGAPLRSWLNGDLAPMASELLSPSAIRQRGLFDPKEVDRIIAANKAGAEDNALRIWALLTLELWQRTFVDGARQHPAPGSTPV